jgi:hypothetical protein
MTKRQTERLLVHTRIVPFDFLGKRNEMREIISYAEISAFNYNRNKTKRWNKLRIGIL